MSDSDSEPASLVISQQTPVTENCREQSTPLSDKTNETTNDLILEVRKMNTSITNFSNRMDAIESRLQSVEKQQQRAAVTPSSSGDSAES